MASILIVYGTTDGQTAKIADFLRESLEATGAVARAANARAEEVAPDAFDGVIVAAPIRAGRFNRDVEGWVQRHREKLQGRPTAFVGVCLAVLQKEPAVQADLARIISRFLETTGWQPGTTTVVAGALRYTRYNWITRWFMKRIAAKAGGNTDTTRDHEYTNWEELRTFAGQFAERVRDAGIAAYFASARTADAGLLPRARSRSATMRPVRHRSS